MRETLAYMLHQLPFDQKVTKPRVPELVASPVKPRMIEIPAGTATLGLARCQTNLFGWDNEYESTTIAVPAFSISQYEVTNREYLQFMNAGGYENQALWRDADWKWKTQHNISHPVFWNRANGEWLYRTMFEEIPLPPDWPVYVSQAEASAYARWSGKSLPTEEQWQRAAYGTADGSERFYPWGVVRMQPQIRVSEISISPAGIPLR